MFQLKRRSDTVRAWRFMATVVLYQDSRHESPLLGIRRQLGIGYVSRRRDGITEVRIQGFRQVHHVLCVLLPYLRFKRAQAKAVVSACALLTHTRIAKMTRRQKERIGQCLMTVQAHNYATRRKKSMSELQRIIGLTP